LIFAGDIRKQPAYREFKFKCVGSMYNTEYVMKNSFFVGVYPGIDMPRLNYILTVFEEFFEGVEV